MFCTKCGKEIKEGSAFCTSCGKPVQASQNTQAAAAASKKSHKAVWIALIVICVLLLLGAGIGAAVYFLGVRNNAHEEIEDIEREDEESSKSREESEESTEPEDKDGVVVQQGEFQSHSLEEVQAALAAYQLYLDQQGYTAGWGEDYYGCDLIYLDNDDIPEVVICGMYEAAGNSILTYDGEQVHEMMLGRLNFTYMERKNLLCNSEGHMGYYYDVVYSIVDGVLTQVAFGTYEFAYDDQGSFAMDENGNEIMEYTWNGEVVTEAQYAEELEKVYPAGQYPVKNPSYFFYDGAFYKEPYYTAVDDAYTAGVKGLIETLGWIGVPQAAGEQEIKDYFDADKNTSFVLMALQHQALLYKIYPDARRQEYWFNISEQDMGDFLLHSVGTDDLSGLISISYTDPDNLNAYSNYIDHRFIIVSADTGDRWVDQPEITDITEISEGIVQVSGTLVSRYYSDNSWETTLFTLKMRRDIDSAWGYCLIGVDRWETYLLPDVDSRYLTEADVQDWSPEALRYARNEIYARHGRRFDDEGLQAYFDNRSWYEGSIAPEDFDDSVLNEFEIANRDFLVEYERKLGYR